VLARSGRGESPGWKSYEGVDVYRTPPIKSKAHAIFEVSKFFFITRNMDFSAVYATGSFRTVVGSCLWSKLLGIPILRESAMSGTIAQHRGLQESLLRWSFKTADIAVARTTQEEKKLRGIGIDQNRIYRASYPVDDRTFKLPTLSQRREARNQLGLPQTATVYLIVGKLGSRKNQRFGLDVLSELPDDHHLVLAGPSDGDYRSQLDREARKLEVRNRLKIVDEYVSNVTPYYWAADTLWIPSRREGVPNVMKEALICGVPVVLNEDLGLQDQVGEEDGVFHAPLEAGAFLRRVRTATNRYEVPSRQLHNVGQQRFGISEWGEEFSVMLTDLVGSQE
jgi:glycosyltransferase involved in cell wall biosynthesis